MKKSMAILVFLLFAATGAFARDFSVSIGIGGLFDWSFNNGAELKYDNDKYYSGFRNLSFGGFIFFDLTYVEVEAGFTYGLLASVEETPSDSKTTKAGSVMQVGASILGKYPFGFGKVTFFPLIGASYNAVLTAKDKDGSDYYDSLAESNKYLSQFGLLGGAGIDIDLTRSAFLRIEAMYHIRFANKETKNLADSNPDAYTTLGKGPRAKIGIGYRF